jgi:hypothetical protein
VIAPEWRQRVQIKVDFGGTVNKHWIRKRQSMQELTAHLIDYPKPQHNCHWVYNQGREMDASVMTYEWHNGEILQIWHTPSYFEEETTAAGSAVTCSTGGSNSKPSDKDTPWTDEERRIKVERIERCLFG